MTHSFPTRRASDLNENLSFASNVSGTVMSIKSMSKRLLWRRTKVAHFLQDISSSDTFSVKFLGNDVCHVTLLNCREYVDSHTTEPTMLTQLGRSSWRERVCQ